MVLDEIKSIRQKGATQFGVLKACCYPEDTGNDITRMPDVISGSQTIAETDGVRLTNLHVEKYCQSDIETRFIWLLHEVTHAEVSGNCRGKSSHNPDFWEAYQDNFNKIIGNTKNRCITETIFGNGLDEFDWQRAKYRAVQNVSQVDNRSESIAERKEKLAASIGYNEYDTFENGDWGLWLCGENKDVPCYDENCIRIKSKTKRFIDKYSVSTDEMIELIEKNDGICPMPLLLINDNVKNELNEESVSVDSNDDWKIAPVFTRESQIALAVQERLGHKYVGLNIKMVNEKIENSKDISTYSRASPVDTDQLRAAIKNNKVI